jgi:alanine-alpha-ketoisovalerate/valine-pyruvate aminotransferase
MPSPVDHPGSAIAHAAARAINLGGGREKLIANLQEVQRQALADRNNVYSQTDVYGRIKDAQGHPHWIDASHLNEMLGRSEKSAETPGPPPSLGKAPGT